LNAAEKLASVASLFFNHMPSLAWMTGFSIFSRFDGRVHGHEIYSRHNNFNPPSEVRCCDICRIRNLARSKLRSGPWIDGSLFFGASPGYSMGKYKNDMLYHVVLETANLRGGGSVIDRELNYLIYEDKSDIAFKMFNELVSAGSPGLCITTLYPQKLRKLYGMGEAKVYWLSDSAGDKDTLSPTRLDFEITRVINKFIKGEENPVFLLDGMAYLSLENDYDKVRKFIKRINDMASMNEATIMVVINPNSFNKETLAMLERDFDKVGTAEELSGTAAPQAAAPAPVPVPQAAPTPHIPSPAIPTASDLRIAAPTESPADIPVEEDMELLSSTIIPLFFYIQQS
jgi:hypothetical protein